MLSNLNPSNLVSPSVWYEWLQRIQPLTLQIELEQCFRCNREIRPQVRDFSNVSHSAQNRAPLGIASDALCIRYSVAVGLDVERDGLYRDVRYRRDGCDR